MKVPFPGRPVFRPVGAALSTGASRRWCGLSGWLTGVFCFAVGSVAPGNEQGARLGDLLKRSDQSPRPLSEIVGSVERLTLEGSQSHLEIEIPLNPRLELLGGEALVHYTHSRGLDGNRSRMVLSWDGDAMGEGRLGQVFQEGEVRAALADDLVQVERSRFRIEIEQRLEKSAAEERRTGKGETPWTQIDPSRSWISLNYRFRPLDPVLSDLRGLVDGTLWDDPVISMVTAPVYSLTDSHLDWGNRTVQRLALWMEDRTLRVRHDDSLSKDRDEVAIGTRDELIGILPQSICDQITSSFVGVYSHPEDGGRFLLVLSGADREGVDRAVRIFAYSPERLPGLPRIDVTRWDVPSPESSSKSKRLARRVDMPELKYWSQSGYPGSTGEGGGAGLDLWVTHWDSQTIGSTMTLAARLTQVAEDMVPDLGVIADQPLASRHWMALGARHELPETLLAASPYAAAFPEGELMGRQGLLMQFESPFESGRAAGLITADDRVLLEKRVNELVQAELWEQLHGDTVTWQGDSESARFRRLAGRFEVGSSGWFWNLWRWLSKVPWLSLGFGLVGAATITWLLLRPVQGADPATIGLSRRNGNRRFPRGRRILGWMRRSASARMEKNPPPVA